MLLKDYHKKRDFRVTSEPRGTTRRRRKRGLTFVIQKHAASHLHYDLRLELDGVLKSWAVPKGPSLDPARKSLAVQVEDHPLEYGDFEGIIPAKQYGGGTVAVWDRGLWSPLGDAADGLKQGKLHFTLSGEKLNGEWVLARMRSDRAADSLKPNWLLMKVKDEHASAGSSIIDERPESVKTGRTLEEIASASRNGTTHAARKLKSSISAGKPMPQRVLPQLASVVESPPVGNDWLHEIKFDGYRIIALVSHGKVTLLTRSGLNWTRKFPGVARDLQSLALESVILDGELVALDTEGRSDFHALQAALSKRKTQATQFHVFDLLHLNGSDVRAKPLLERKKLLEEVVESAPRSSTLKLSEYIRGNGTRMAEAACKMALEGIVSKRIDAPYVTGRTDTWRKSKCGHRQEFVVLGYTLQEGGNHLGAMLVGYFDKARKLVYAGRVGTGFDHVTSKSLLAKLNTRKRSNPPGSIEPSRRELRSANWVAPSLVIEVQFAGWTRDGMVRQGSFKGIREDKSPRKVIRESNLPRLRRKKAIATAIKKPDAAGVALTHPDRVLFAEAKLTKADLVSYYVTVVEQMLPHVKNRPLTLLRCPSGRAGTCFYQRHFTESLPDAVERINVGTKRAPEYHLMIRNYAGLVSLVQIGALEIHTWGSTADDIEHPDRLVFDLDPDTSLSWRDVVNVARAFRKLLFELELPVFLKTTGGKGLHLVVPIEQTVGWDQAKAFTRVVAEEFVRLDPDARTVNVRKAARHGKVFIDYLRNGRSATSVAPFSVRAREHAPISLPIAWDALGRTRGGTDFTVSSVLKQKLKHRDPWADFDSSRVDIANIVAPQPQIRSST